MKIKRTKSAPFRDGDYVTDGRDISYVIEATPDKTFGQLLHIEEVRSGNSYDMCEHRFYRRCKKPPSFKQEVHALCRKYGYKVAGRCTCQREAFEDFAKEFMRLQEKHGDQIYTKL